MQSEYSRIDDYSLEFLFFLLIVKVDRILFQSDNENHSKVENILASYSEKITYYHVTKGLYLNTGYSHSFDISVPNRSFVHDIIFGGSGDRRMLWSGAETSKERKRECRNRPRVTCATVAVHAHELDPPT